MRHKKIVRLSVLLILVAVLCVNIIAVFQAYKFTHYDSSVQNHEKVEGASFAKRLKAIFLGVDLPRPQNTILPDRAFEVIILEGENVTECWALPVDSVQSAKGTVILCHGYGGSMSDMLAKTDVFLQSGYNAFLFNFMGSGGSEGSRTTIGYYEAEQVKMVYDYVSANEQGNIILFGTSMGAAAIMKAEYDYHLRPKAVILECPYASMLRTVQNRFAITGIPKFPMSNLLVFWGGVMNGFNAFGLEPVRYAEDIDCPTLLIYGQKDNKVMQDETNEIFARIKRNDKVLKQYPLAGHDNYLEQYKAEWESDIKTFLNNL